MSDITSNVPKSLINTIPADLRESFADSGIAHVSFGTGPGCMVGEHVGFVPRVSLEFAMDWIEHYRHVARRACVVDNDSNRLWFTREGFERAEFSKGGFLEAPVPQLEICVDEPPSSGERRPFPGSDVHSALIDAYANTAFRVFGLSPFTLRVGELNQALPCYSDRLQGAAFITAYNPFSEALTEEVNRQRHAALRGYLEEKGIEFCDGEGGDDAGEWPPEVSCYLSNVSLFEATKIGKQWGQNAIVWASNDQIPRLIMLR